MDGLSGRRIIAVAAALLTDEAGRFMLCRRPANKARPLRWEFPGGKLEPGETPYEAIERECLEELDARVRAICPVTEAVHTYPDITIRLTLMHIALTRGSVRPLEHTEIRFVDADEAETMDLCPADRALLPEVRAYLHGLKPEPISEAAHEH